MEEQLIVAKNAETERGERLRLGYYLLTSEVNAPGLPVHTGYGIKILLQREDGVVEECEMADLSGYKLGILTLLRILAAHTVLPIAMRETVFDYLEANNARG